MTPRLLAPLRDFTEEEARAILNELWKGYDWEEIVAICSKARAERLARENGSASDPPRGSVAQGPRARAPGTRAVTAGEVGRRSGRSARPKGSGHQMSDP